MRTLRTVSDLRIALAQPRREGRRIGLVPTMGALHEGHLSLMRRAREECDEVVVTLFVNPTQFNQRSDLDAYPRDEEGDIVIASEQGVDYLFAPPVSEIYPDGFATTISISGITAPLEGAHRGREHFEGVATVVCKLFNIVAPDVAYFGQKDAQQVAVIRRMVADLNLPVAIAVCPTVRDPDGLALSSRNAHLSASEREAALSLSRALALTAATIRDGERQPAVATAPGRATIAAAGAVLEYFELVTPDGLEPVTEIDRPVLAVVAARVGRTRLIDNAVLEPLASPLQPAAATVPGRS